MKAIRRPCLVLFVLAAFSCNGNKGKSSLSSRKDDDLFPVNPSGKLGYIDRTGKIVIKPQFDFAADFWEGRAHIAIDGKHGYIDRSGSLVIEPHYSTAYDFLEGRSVVCKNGGWGFIDLIGRFVAIKEAENLAIVTSRYTRQGSMGQEIVPGDLIPKSIKDQESRSWGYIDRFGQTAIAPQFDYAFPFHNGLALVWVDSDYGYIDNKGRYVWQATNEVPLEDKKWLWNSKGATLENCISHVNTPVRVSVEKNKTQLDPENTAPGQFLISVAWDSKPSYSFPAHSRTVLCIEQAKLYYADFNPKKPGCRVIAVDLNLGQQLWRTQLKGGIPIQWSLYDNSVVLAFEKDKLVVYGKEYRSYIEVLDPDSGRILAHKVVAQ